MNGFSRALALAAVGHLAGCVQFNECDADRGQRLGNAAIDLDIRESIVRTQEAPIGNLVADAIFTTARAVCADGIVPCPAFALQNAGGIREETSCGRRERIEAGAVYERDIDELLPFENELVVVAFTGADIALALERATSRLGQVGENANVGYFLQVSRLSFDVTCAGEAQTLNADLSGIERPGARVSNIAIDSETGPVALDPLAEYEVALNDYIAQGNDGFLSFLLRDENDNVIVDGDGNPAAKYNPDQDRVLRESGEPLSEKAAVVAYIDALERANVAAGRPAEGRINVDESCFLGGEQ
jgi:2',3'-cyclic-nucleotide 2'-phosphodiesterase (5'-nucleotidase family)